MLGQWTKGQVGQMFFSPFFLQKTIRASDRNVELKPTVLYRTTQLIITIVITMVLPPVLPYGTTSIKMDSDGMIICNDEMIICKWEHILIIAMRPEISYGTLKLLPSISQNSSQLETNRRTRDESQPCTVACRPQSQLFVKSTAWDTICTGGWLPNCFFYLT